ncbi:MAG: hypothetical protein LUD47_01455 [Clostridia bacterium]|nr:hypothetical protein [Clostridia bacterium]
MADKDVSPNLLKKVQTSFENSLNSNATANSLMQKIDNGSSSYAVAEKYAIEVGEALSESFEKNLSSSVLPDGKMYWHIGESVIDPMFEESYEKAKSAAVKVQTNKNTKNNVHLSARDPDKYVRGKDGAAGTIIGKLCQADQYDDAAWMLRDEAALFAVEVVDNALERNVDFQGQNGYAAKIVRTASDNCCPWCAEVEGEYEYPLSDNQRDVYRRHDNCKCAVDYEPGDHSGQVQDVWSKEWRDENDAVKLEDRKTYGKQRTWVKNEAGKYRKQRR